MSIILVLIRHPETEGNVAMEMTELERPNHMFVPTENGWKQIDRVLTTYEELRLTRPHKIYCSTFYRTRVVAVKFSQKFRQPEIVEDSRLNEKWDGIFHSLPMTAIADYYPEEIVLRNKIGWYHYSAPGGENCPAVELRIRSLLFSIAVPQNEGKTILLCTHGNWQICFEKIALNQRWEGAQRAKKERLVPNCAISVFDFYPPETFEHKVDRYAPWQNDSSTKYA